MCFSYACKLAILLSNQEQSVPVRGWMIHGATPEYQAKVLRAAVRYHINHLEISGDNPTTSEEMATPAGDLVARTATQAKALGINSYFWVREFNTKNRTVSLDPGTTEGAKFWSERENALVRALEKAPDLAGVIMSYASTPTEIWHATDKSTFWTGMSVPNRIAYTTQFFKSIVVDRFHKRMYVRDFNHSPQQLHWLVDGLKDFAGITMHSKWEPQDWQLFYPDSFSIGAYGSTPQVIEADLGAEYWGRSIVPVSLVHYIKKRWDYDRQRGCKGIVARIDRDDQSALDTPNEINIYALSKYLEDPRRTPEQIYSDWIFERYGLSKGSIQSKAMESIYEEGLRQAKLQYFTLGFWTPKDQTMIPSTVASIQGCIPGKSNALWDPAAKELEGKLVHPNEETYRLILKDRDEAVRISELNLLKFGKIKSALRHSDADDWQTRLELANRFAKVWRVMADAVWSLRVAEEAKLNSPAILAALRAKAYKLKTESAILVGKGPGERLRLDMNHSAVKLAFDIAKRAEKIESHSR